MKKNRPKLIVAASEASSDMLYATGFHAPDPFAFAEVDGCRSILLSDLEVDRGRKEAEVDQVFAYSDIEEVVQGRKKRKPDYAFVLAAWLHALGTQEVDVPADFPFLLARQLEKLGVQLNPVDGFFWPTRECKSADQLKAVRRAVQLTETGMERALQVLRAAKIRRDGFLTWGGGLLTSERLRSELEGAILMAGGQITSRSIVAGGEQACDPHERGSGPLRAHTLIILDVFPRDPESGYYGDITRTVVRGQATDAQRQLWKVCLKGQKYALQQMAPGVSGETIHEAIKAQFAQAGYPTEQRDGRWVGFFHGTGHGLGLDLHEPPRFSRTIFKPGQVLTVEPGIYWPGVGGVRHEDDVVVTETGVQKLSRIPKVLEI